MTRDEIVKEAESWLGTRFLDQGRSKVGVDCVGLVQVVGDVFDCHYEDIAGYDRAPHDSTFLKHLQKFTVPQPINGNKHGLIGVFRESVCPCHIGIFKVEGERTSVIHARVRSKKVIEETWDPKTLKLVLLLGFPGMEN